MEKNLEQEWHALDRDVVCGHLDVDCDSGLSTDEARLRLERFGPNELKEEAGTPAWVLFLHQVGLPE